MNDVSQDIEILRSQLIAEGERWMFEPTAWERALVDEIQKLPVYIVPRLPTDEALRIGMLPKKCHLNAITFAQRDPDRKTMAVAGWFRQADLYLMHSVTIREGMLRCVTPMPRIPGDTIDFIPDPAIEWRTGEGKTFGWRNGRAVGIGVRANPDHTLQLFGPILDRLRSGMHPYEALGKRYHAASERAMRRSAQG